MEDNINILIANFEQGLNQLLVNSQLPVGVAYYILKNQADKLQNNYVGFINSYYAEQAELERQRVIEEESIEPK